MGSGPSCSRDELIAAGLQSLESVRVTARTLIYDRIELEVDLINPAGEVDPETGPVDLGM